MPERPDDPIHPDLADVLTLAIGHAASLEHDPARHSMAVLIVDGLRAHFQRTRHRARWAEAAGTRWCVLCLRPAPEGPAVDNRECYSFAADPGDDLETLTRELRGARLYLGAAVLSHPKQELRISDHAFTRLDAKASLTAHRDPIKGDTILKVTRG